MAIDKIRIQGVRGIRSELTIDLDGKSLVLRGDNGTGKSSIVAGLLWALRGDDEPLATAKIGSEEAYRANVLEGAARAHVILELKGGGKLAVTPGKVDADARGQHLRAGCSRSTPFLLRKHLLRFLEYKPGDRFKYLEAFLDLEEADNVREAFAARAEVHKKESENQRRTRDGLLRGVTDVLPRELTPTAVSWSSMCKALVEWSRALGVLSQGAGWDDVVLAAKRLEELLDGDQLTRARLAIAASERAWSALASLPPPADPAPILERRDRLAAQCSDADLAALLEEARKHFQAHQEKDVCPVCEQRVDTKSLGARLDERLRTLADLTAARVELAATGEAWRAFWAKATEAVSSLRIVPSAVALDAPPGATDELLGLREPTAYAQAVARLGAGRLGAWAATACEKAQASLTEVRKKLPTEEDTSAVRKLVDAVDRAERARLAVTVAEAAAEDADQRARALGVVHEALRTARQDIARQLLDEISGLVNEFYGAIHPPDAQDEITGPPEIVVKRHSGGTAHVRGQFHAKPVEDPRWVYSDGHLDTVGICVYLALRRFRATRDGSADPKLMILDDIVLSVDLGHGRRLLDLLRTRFSDHQVLIFTHNGLFTDWCAEKLPAFKRKAIARWTVETGPQLGEYRSMMERIEQQIEDETSPKLLAQAVMNLMDEWLAQARFEYELSVRARRGEEYTLTDIWNPFTKRLKDLEKGLNAPIGNLSDIMSDLGALVSMRNRLAAHENEFAHEFPLAAVRQVAQRAVELVRLLYCTKCVAFAAAIPTVEAPDLVRCKANCEHIRYDRLRKVQPTSVG